MGESEVTTVGLRLGPGFPTHLYNLVHTHVEFRGRFGKRHAGLWRTSWNAVAFRFDALRYHDAEFRKLLADAAHGDPHRHRSAQERELFAFFASASALFECFAYATYVLLAATKTSGFTLRTLSDQQRIGLKRALVPDLRRELPSHEITKGFSRLIRSRAFEELQDIRNYLSHRTAPSRAIFHELGTTGARSDEWNLRIHGRANIPISPTTTFQRLEWCGDMLGVLMPRVERYADSHLRPQRPQT